MQAVEEARREAAAYLQEQRAGIGTLRERSLHAALKYWLEPDERFHEVKLEQGCVADICDGHRVVEIQTGNLYALRDKLTALLPAWPVTVVHPLPRRKRLIWVDPESGEATPPRLTPKTGRFTDALDQLYGLLPLIGDPNLTVVLLLVDLDEYRLRDGWSRDGKRGSHRTERFPTAMGDSLALSCREDYAKLLPDGLPAAFTVAEFGRAARLTPNKAGKAVRFFVRLGLVTRTGKRGRAYEYERTGDICGEECIYQ